MFLCETQDLFILDNKCGLFSEQKFLALDVAKLVDIQSEDLSGLRQIERRIIKRKMNPGLESLVNSTDSICS